MIHQPNYKSSCHWKYRRQCRSKVVIPAKFFCVTVINNLFLWTVPAPAFCNFSAIVRLGLDKCHGTNVFGAFCTTDGLDYVGSYYNGHCEQHTCKHHNVYKCSPPKSLWFFYILIFPLNIGRLFLAVLYFYIIYLSKFHIQGIFRLTPGQ